MVDRYYRRIWSRKTKPPLMQMQEEGKNMADVRRDLGVNQVESGKEGTGTNWSCDEDER